MELGLKGKLALVLASSQGLGKAIAQGLLREGARVVITSRNQENIEVTKSEIKATAAFSCDISKPGAIKELVDKVQKELGPIDILITNAGGPPKGTFESTTVSQWQDGFSSLWLSVVEAAQSVLPQMKERKYGRIILITSTSGKEPIANLTISNGLRAGLANLANSLSQEVGSFGVTVNVVMPGYMMTDRLKELGVSLDKIQETVPAKRIGNPEELADLVTFLSSDRAAYINGQSIAIDGGRLRSI